MATNPKNCPDRFDDCTHPLPPHLWSEKDVRFVFELIGLKVTEQNLTGMDLLGLTSVTITCDNEEKLMNFCGSLKLYYPHW